LRIFKEQAAAPSGIVACIETQVRPGPLPCVAVGKGLFGKAKQRRGEIIGLRMHFHKPDDAIRRHAAHRKGVVR